MRASAGAAEQVWQTRRPRDQMNVLTEIALPTLTYRRESSVSSVQIHARTNLRSGRKRELRRPENEQMHKFERGGHTFLAGVDWNKIRLTDRLACMDRSFTRFPGELKPPMNTYLHACVPRPDVKCIRILLLSHD